MWTVSKKRSYIVKFDFFSNDLRWRNDQTKSWRSQKVMQLCSWQLFHSKSSIQGKLGLNFSYLKFEFFKRPRWRNDQIKCCTSRIVIKLCNLQPFHLSSSMHGRLHLNFLYLKLKIFKRPQWRNDQNQSFRSQKVINFVVDNFLFEFI
jgi:hypothetical protein